MTSQSNAPQSMVEPALSEAAAFVERTLDALLPKPSGPEARLLDAMRYATLGGAARFRGFLVLQSGRLFSVDGRALSRVVAAVECVHAHALAHNDLPALDGNETRRGRPSLYKAFDPATAILAGDALMTLAFGFLGSTDGIGDPYVRAELVTRLALAAGHGGMAGGQMLQMVFAGATGAASPPLPEISRLQRMKTAALITFCCEAGAILGRASPPARHALSAYGQDVGLAFQITADIAAAEGGKAGSGKPTVVSAMGPERAHAQAVALSAQAVRHLDLFDEKAELLRAAAEFIVARGVVAVQGSEE